MPPGPAFRPSCIYNKITTKWCTQKDAEKSSSLSPKCKYIIAFDGAHRRAGASNALYVPILGKQKKTSSTGVWSCPWYRPVLLADCPGQSYRLKRASLLTTMWTNKLCAWRHDMPPPAPLLPVWAPKRLVPPSTPQRGSSFPRPIRSHAHRCSCLMP